MKRIIKYLLSGLVLISFVYSCAEGLNFDQLDDVEITPTIEGSILYVESSERLINHTIGSDFFVQEFNFGAFNEKFFADKVIDGVITYIVENTTSKNLDIIVEFIDEAGNVLDNEQFTLLPAPTAVLQREITYGPTGRSIEIIKNVTALRINARNLGDNTSESSLPDPKVTVKSSGKFKIRLR